MRTVIVICLLSVVAMTLARPQDKYTDKFDNLNLDEILENRRLLVPYIKCTLDQGKCSPEGKELKANIKDALETECSKCTEVQQKGTRKVFTHLIKHEKDYWNELIAKYDPERKYVSKYEAEIKEIEA